MTKIDRVIWATFIILLVLGALWAFPHIIANGT